jgi:hyperosmotically inducible protein
MRNHQHNALTSTSTWNLNGIAPLDYASTRCKQAALQSFPRVQNLNNSTTENFILKETFMLKNRARFGSILLSLTLSVAVIAATNAAPTGQETKANQNLVREVRHQLLLLPYYTVFDNLAFKVDGDHVTLEGQVTNPVLKHDAEAAVKSIEGVSGITNNIEVLPPSPMDDQLRRALYRAIYSEPSLSKYGWSAMPSIHSIVKNGHVALEGVVDNEANKNLAGLRANSVPNVFEVKNNLVVKGNH